MNDCSSLLLPLGYFFLFSPPLLLLLLARLLNTHTALASPTVLFRHYRSWLSMNKNHNKNMDDVWCCPCTICAKVKQQGEVPRTLATKRDYVEACDNLHARSEQLGEIKSTHKGKCDRIATLGLEKTDLQQRLGSSDEKIKSLETEVDIQKRANQDAVAAFRHELYVTDKELAEKVLEITELKQDNAKVNTDPNIEHGRMSGLRSDHGLKMPQGMVQCDHSSNDSVLLPNASQLKKKDDFIDKFRDDLALKNDEIDRLTSDLACIRNEFDRLCTLTKSKVSQNSSLHEKLKLKEDEINKSKQALKDNDKLR